MLQPDRISIPELVFLNEGEQQSYKECRIITLQGLYYDLVSQTAFTQVFRGTYDAEFDKALSAKIVEIADSGCITVSEKVQCLEDGTCICVIDVPHIDDTVPEIAISRFLQHNIGRGECYRGPERTFKLHELTFLTRH